MEIADSMKLDRLRIEVKEQSKLLSSISPKLELYAKTKARVDFLSLQINELITKRNGATATAKKG